MSNDIIVASGTEIATSYRGASQQPDFLDMDTWAFMAAADRHRRTIFWRVQFAATQPGGENQRDVMVI